MKKPSKSVSRGLPHNTTSSATEVTGHTRNVERIAQTAGNAAKNLKTPAIEYKVPSKPTVIEKVVTNVEEAGSKGGMKLKLNLQLFASKNPTIRINELQQAIDNRGSGYFERLQNSRQYGYTPSEEYYANLRAGRSNTSSPINYNHTLNLEINSTTSRIVGGHATNGNVIVGEIVETYPSGVYDAHVYMRDPVNPNNLIPKSNNNGISTLVPNWWTDDRVKYEFDSAYQNRILYNNQGSLMWKGITPSGIEVRGYEPTNRNPNATAYPKR